MSYVSCQQSSRPARIAPCLVIILHDNSLKNHISDALTISACMLGVFPMALLLSYQKAFLEWHFQHQTQLPVSAVSVWNSFWFKWNPSDLTKQVGIRLGNRIKLFPFHFILLSRCVPLPWEASYKLTELFSPSKSNQPQKKQKCRTGDDPLTGDRGKLGNDPWLLYQLLTMTLNKAKSVLLIKFHPEPVKYLQAGFTFMLLGNVLRL